MDRKLPSQPQIVLQGFRKVVRAGANGHARAASNGGWVSLSFARWVSLSLSPIPPSRRAGSFRQDIHRKNRPARQCRSSETTCTSIEKHPWDRSVHLGAWAPCSQRLRATLTSQWCPYLTVRGGCPHPPRAPVPLDQRWVSLSLSYYLSTVGVPISLPYLSTRTSPSPRTLDCATSPWETAP